MAASGSTKVILAALGANGLIAVSKFVAAAWTGSAAMLSEAIHSLADTANQGLLLHGMRRSQRPADAAHPFGHAKELYFWAFVVAILLFSLGSGVAIYEGVAKIRDPHPVTDPWINYMVLGAAMLFEGISTIFALREFNKQRNGERAFTAIRRSKDPALFTVLLEDTAALTGLVVAMIGVACGHLLGWSMADGIASIVIGIILGLVAAIMSIETKSLLIGESASPQLITAMRMAIMDELGPSGPVRTIHDLRTMHLGPDVILVTASLDFNDEVSAKTVEATVARLDALLRARFPQVRHLYLEAQAAPASAPAPAGDLAAPASIAPAQVPSKAGVTMPARNHPPARKKGKRKGRR